jgi:transposase
MMGLPAGTRIWIAAGFTDMRCGFNGLAAKVESALQDDPFLCSEAKYVSTDREHAIKCLIPWINSRGRRHIISTGSQADLGRHPSVETDGPRFLG